MENDIRDIHGPVAIPSPWLFILIALAVLALLFLAYFAWRNYRKNKKRFLLPHEIALEELEKARSLMKTSTLRPYTFTVSEIVRNYIEKRFHVLAAHRTTEEFLHDFAQPTHLPLASHATSLEQFLKNCDLVKFAKWPLNQQEMEAMHASAVRFVTETRPQPEEKEKKTTKEASKNSLKEVTI